jgi:hypothetical protein
MKKVLVKVYGEKEWSPLMFGSREIDSFENAISIANITRLRCKVKLVDENDKTLRKWDNY